MKSEKQSKRLLYLAARKGDHAGAEQHARDLAAMRGDGDWESVLASESIVPRSGNAGRGARGGSGQGVTAAITRHARGAAGSLTRTYDQHAKIVLGTTVAVSTVAGVKLNQFVGRRVTPLQVQSSTLAGLAAFAAALLARYFKMHRTSQVLLAASFGQGLATVNEHLPEVGLLGPKTSSPKP